MRPKFDDESIARYASEHGEAPAGNGVWIFGAGYSDAKGNWCGQTFTCQMAMPFKMAKVTAYDYFVENAPSGAVECHFAILP